MNFAIKAIWQYPSYLRLVATLPWEIKHLNFLQIWKKYKQIAFLIGSNWSQITFFLLLFFYLLTFRINLWHRKYFTVDVTAVFVNNQHGSQRRGQKFDKKKFVFERVHRKKFTDEFPQNSWTKHSVNNRLLKQLWDTGTVTDHAVTTLKKTLRQLMI